MSQPQAPKYRKWCATFQNPDPTWHHPKENFIKEMHSMVPDITKIVWAYEMGDKPVGELNPAYVEGEETGGNLHYQIYFETSKQYRQSAMRQHLTGFWVEWSYAPKSALNYACKADHTLIEGPWSWDNGKGGQGTRNDLNEVYEAVVKKGSSYNNLFKQGQHLAVLAKHERFVKQMENLRDGIGEKDITWPKRFHGFDMLKPNPAVKQRHWWIIGPPDIGKTFFMGNLFDNQKAYYIGSNSENRWERYDDQEVIIYDDVKHPFDEISPVTQTINFPMDLPGKIRYVGKTFRKKSCRNVIILTNKTIEATGYSTEHIIAMHKRFIIIDMNIPVEPLVQAGFKRAMTDAERCKQKQCKHVEGECPIHINDDF